MLGWGDAWWWHSCRNRGSLLGWRSGAGTALFPGGWQALEEDHGGSAARTDGRVERGFRGVGGGCVAAGIRVSEVHGFAAQEHHFHPRLAGGGMVESAIPDAVQASWQDVAEVAAGELDAFNFTDAFDASMRAVFPAEGDVGVADGDDAAVADDAAPDVGSEVFDGIGSAAEGLHIDGP